MILPRAPILFQVETMGVINSPVGGLPEGDAVRIKSNGASGRYHDGARP